MKNILRMFQESAKEFTKVRSLVVTAMFVAISMIIELFSINIVFAKLNFAYLAIAVIGMLFGPCMGVVAGFACDIVGYLVHPDGGFLPAYVLVAGLQGLIYGVCLYYKMDGHSIMFVNNTTQKQHDITLYLRAIVARLLDVILINLLINTRLNMHYGFIPEEAYSTAIVVRIVKNIIELVIDFPMLFVLLPVALTAYQRVFRKSTVTATN
ncbi:MAG: folate family ECF transporter S component [Ruminococcus sp.]|nr:folate family ECF transporter S component [Ruminococcus sp.]